MFNFFKFKELKENWKKFIKNFTQEEDDIKINPAAIWLLGLVLIVCGFVFVFYAKIIHAPTLTEGFTNLPSGEIASDRFAVQEGISQLEEDEPVAVTTGLENKIIIPKMGVAAQIYEGGVETLSRGVWIMPRTSTPDKGGNTVITAHRWLYKPPDPRTFYNIDKMAVGDKFTIDWQGKKYSYEVFETKVVTPQQTEILYPTKDPIVTLFTCTPLFSTDFRMVVKAKLLEVVDVVD